MVSAIYCSKYKNYRPSQYKWFRMGDDDENDDEAILDYDQTKLYDSFDNMTGYFTDLGYWNSLHGLHKQNGLEGKTNVLKAINKMQQEGITPYEGSDDTYWHWNSGGCQEDMMSDEDRKKILLYHLMELYKILDKYDNPEEYFFIIN